jgi:signal transduction histidine kinase
MMETELLLPLNKAPKGRARVLAVDNLPEQLAALRFALKDESFELVEATSGAAALRLAQREDFAVILLAAQMPEMDGYETARRLRECTLARGTPIVFLTTTPPTGELALRGYEAGAIDTLTKPVDPAILRAKLNNFVGLHKAKTDLTSLREALNLRDEFLYIASHELKTPITPLQLQLQGFLRMIEADKLGSMPVQQLKLMLEISDAQVSRLSRLIEQLLDVSRLDEGRFSLEFSNFDLSEAVDDTVKQGLYQIEAAQCRLRLDLAPGLRGHWDRLRLEQVVLNLLLNSTKYAAGGWIEVSTQRRGDKALLSVTDNGIGVARQDQDRIFGRFERAVPVKNFSGLGLGLYVAREIVRLHGGRIRVDSEQGKGATFEVELPLISDVMVN